MKPEHVAIVTTSFPERAGDPAGHFVATEAVTLAKAGHRVTVIAPGSNREFDGLRVIGVGAGSSFGWPGALTIMRSRPHRSLAACSRTRFATSLCRLSSAARARRELRSLPCDRVIAHWLVPSGWPIATAASIPLEVVAHGSDVRLLCRLPTALRHHVVSRLLARRARVRCVSDELRDELVACDARLAGQISVDPAPIDTSHAPDRPRARRLLGLPKAARLIVIAGRLVLSKRVHVALTAAELIPNAIVVVIGDGPEASTLAESHPDAHFPGLVPRDHALTWIAAADLVLSASRTEGAPTVLREARALGVPVVSTAAGDLERWARSDGEIWVVD